MIYNEMRNEKRSPPRENSCLNLCAIWFCKSLTKYIGYFYSTSIDHVQIGLAVFKGFF